MKPNPCTTCCLPYKLGGLADWRIPLVEDDYVCEHLIEAGREIRAKACESYDREQMFKHQPPPPEPTDSGYRFGNRIDRRAK